MRIHACGLVLKDMDTDTEFLVALWFKRPRASHYPLPASITFPINTKLQQHFGPEANVHALIGKCIPVRYKEIWQDNALSLSYVMNEGPVEWLCRAFAIVEDILANKSDMSKLEDFLAHIPVAPTAPHTPSTA